MSEELDRQRIKYLEKERDELQSFKSLVRDAMDTLYTAIQFVWVVLGLGIPVLAFFKPMPQEGFYQGLTYALVIWVLFGFAHALKAIGKLKR